MTYPDGFLPHHFPFRKIPRLSRQCVITEKLDGTNCVVHISGDKMFIGSKNRWLAEDSDHYGFRAWCMAHKEELFTLGDGFHYGEWWGGGIQRGYGLAKDDKRFSLFNVDRWCLRGQSPKVRNDESGKVQDVLPPCVALVPIAAECPFNTANVEQVMDAMRRGGSLAVPGYMNPEGIVVYHKAADQLFKKTFDGDGEPKSKRSSPNGLEAAAATAHGKTPAVAGDAGSSPARGA